MNGQAANMVHGLGQRALMVEAALDPKVGNVGTNMLSKTSLPSLPFWRGWIVVLLVSTIVSAYVGGIVDQLVHYILPDSSLRIWMLPLTAITAMLFTVPATIFMGFIPITAAYFLLRLIAHRLPSTFTFRVILGFLLGSIWNLTLLFLEPPHDPIATLLRSEPLYFPYLGIEAAALAVALVSRKHWFGIV